MSIFFSKNPTQNSVNYEDANRCMDGASCIWLTIGNIFQWNEDKFPPRAVTYQRKVQMVSHMFGASFAERLNLLEDLGWLIDNLNHTAVHPQGRIYTFDELSLVLDRQLDKIWEATCVFAETIGYRYDSEGLFTNGEDSVSLETLGSWAKNRQL